MNIRKLTDLFH